SFGDIAILVLLYVQLILGLSTTFVSLDHLDGHEMVKFMTWAQGIITLQPGVADLIADAHPIFKAHLFLGMTLFLVFPFTRLVHVWSAPIWYLGRRGYQAVRSDGRREAVSRGRPVPAEEPMSCPVHVQFPAGKPVTVSVNGVAIARDAIQREMQHHPAEKPIAAWQQAARALVVRELLLQRARHLALTPEPMSDEAGRRETDDEALMRAVVEREVTVPTPD